MTEPRVSNRIEEDEAGPTKATEEELLREGSWGGWCSGRQVNCLEEDHGLLGEKL